MLNLSVYFRAGNNRKPGLTDDLAELRIRGLFAHIRPLNDHGEITVQESILEFFISVAEHIRRTELQSVNHVLQAGHGGFGIDLRIHIGIKIDTARTRKPGQKPTITEAASAVLGGAIERSG